ncbi:MAG TPA: CHAT domain-containing protein, partial [Bryobacteraceae bacterium]|nr:CHAT domain-containing protein [Bryobacteraceae bacterium]
VRVGADVRLQTMYSDYIAAGMKQYEETRDPDLAQRMFLAAEENRATAFREKLLSSTPLPPEYWTTLAQLRQAEVSPQQNHPTPGSQLPQLRLRLVEFESKTGIGQKSLLIGQDTVSEWNSPKKRETKAESNALSVFQQKMLDTEALLSFHAGERGSYLWAITRNSFEVRLLSSNAEIAERVAEFRRAILSDSPAQEALGTELYRRLFGEVTPHVSGKRHWLLVLDGALFQLPIAALRTPDSKYLVEHHSLRILPAAGMLLDRTKVPPARPGRGFMGVGDPIYNTADPRWNARGIIASPGRSSPGGPGWASMEFARLPASQREIQACAAAWKSQVPPILLVGSQVERERVFAALSRQPEVAHFATHVAENPHSEGEFRIVLGLSPGGRPEFLTPGEIAASRYRLGLVALNGCNSGQGKALPGAGLIGLTRSWLICGAQAVAATHWPTNDESGDLFKEFYRFAGRSGLPLSAALSADALQASQIEVLKSRTWHSHPKYWAAYFIVGKD